MAAFTALLVGGLVISAVEQVRAANAAKRAGEAGAEVAASQADLADYNATVADQQARDAIQRGAEQESNFRMGVRGMVGKQRASMAAANVDVSYGSAVDVQADTRYMGELDALTLRNNAAREAWGYRTQGEDLRRRAEIARREGVMLERQGSEARTAGYIGTIGTVVGGAGSLYAQRYGMTGHGGHGSQFGGQGQYSGMPTPIGGLS